MDKGGHLQGLQEVHVCAYLLSYWLTIFTIGYKEGKIQRSL